MTTGIYALVWNDSYDAIYVGQSNNIEYRYTQHLDLLKNSKHYNYKIINATNKYGIPKLIVLEVVPDTSLLDQKEVHWMEEFDTINSGMNITTGGIAGRGLNHSNSKYSKITLLKIFSLLYRTNITYQAVADRCKVSKYIVHNIVSGTHHLWLKDEYPKEFDLMLLNKTSRNKTNVRSLEHRGISYRPLISPEGEVIKNIRSIAELCRTHPLLLDECDSVRSSIGKVLKGTKTSHKGWHLQPQ